MFHGTSGNGLKFWQTGGWKEKAEKEGFVAVFPSSLSYKLCEPDRVPRETTKWSVSRLDEILCNKDDFIADDFGFFKAMVSEISEKIYINEKRIFVSGFSNGCRFVQELVLNAPELLAAASGNGCGIQFTETFSKRIPFYHAIGANDDHIMGDYGITPLPLNSSVLKLYPFSEAIPIALGNLGLKNIPQERTKQNHYQVRYVQPVYPREETGEYVFHVIGNAAHIYPNGINHPLVMAKPLWHFFSRF
jgi:predicted esterase